MKTWMLVMALGLGLVACQKREEAVASKTREQTMREQNLKLDATSNQRFGAGAAVPKGMEAPVAGNSPLAAGTIPEGWEELPGSAFRLLNYRFGTEGEAYVSMSRGGVLDNVNRWLQQFGQPVLDAAGLAKLEKAESAGFEGVWVDVEGDFGGGMGKAAKSDYALAGIVAESGGQILTVKMIGPEAEVAAEKERLRAFVAGLAPAE